MNKNQRLLLKGLTIISNGLSILQDAEIALDEMTEKQVRQVLERFEETICEFNMHEMLKTSYMTYSQSNTVVSHLVTKIDLDESLPQ